jgi:hypothetical protein
MVRFFPLILLAVTGLACSLRGADSAPAPEPFKPENYLMLPEPKVTGSSTSKVFAGALRTVFTPARQVVDARSIAPYKTADFAKLGISWETFLERAQVAAERRLAVIKPELKKNEAGQIAYAVFRGADPSITCLLIAPSLGKIFINIFGKDVWVVTPDRNSLYVFPAKAEALAEFAADLQERFEGSSHPSSGEIFEIKGDGSGLRAIGSLSKR